MGEESSVQRPRSTSSGPRRRGLKRAASDTRRQKFSSAVRAPAAPPFAWPSTSTAAFIAPADVPEMPSIRSHGSSRRRSSTPQVKAPWEPPPCRARSIRMGSRLRTAETLEEAAVCIVPPRQHWRTATHFAGTCAGFFQQTQTRAEPQLVGTHRQQLYATGIPTPKRPTPAHPNPPHPHPARRQPHPGPRPPNPATRAPRHPAPRHPHPPTRPTPPKATWPPPQPRPPQRADASVLESATVPLIAAIAAMTRIILRNIGVTPFHVYVAA